MDRVFVHPNSFLSALFGSIIRGEYIAGVPNPSALWNVVKALEVAPQFASALKGDQRAIFVVLNVPAPPPTRVLSPHTAVPEEHEWAAARS